MKAPVLHDFSRHALLGGLGNLDSPEKSASIHRQMLESLDEGVVVISLDGKVRYCNPRFCGLTQNRHEDLSGMSWSSVLAPGEVDMLAPLQGFQSETGVKTEAKLRRKDGSVVPVFLSVKTAEIGGDPHYLAVAVDLTEMRRAETVLKVGEEQLRQSQKMEAIGRLACGVAHDFNNFLTAINGFSAFLLDLLDRDKVRKDSPLRSGLLEISRAGERAAGLTKQLLAFGRKQAQAPQVVDVNAVVADMHRMLGRLIGEDVELSLHLNPTVAPVNFNPGQLEQIILNLSLNARDAMPKGGRLSIETLNVVLAKPFVVLRFGDNGIGMDAEVKRHLFEPFFTTKKSGQGTGLGLSTVYAIVKQGGGHVDIQSEPGKGTTFEVYLPASVSGTKKPRRPPEIIWPAYLRGKETVLIAEDEYTVRKMTRELLAVNGYAVLEAADGMEALEILRRFPGTVDLLLTDVVMPNMGGRRLAEEVAHLRPGIRILFMSGYTGDAVVQHGITEGDKAFLPKPFTPLVLAQKVRQQLDLLQAGALPAGNR